MNNRVLPLVVPCNFRFQAEWKKGKDREEVKVILL